MIKEHMGELPEGPRLEHCVFTAIGPISVPGQVTKIPKARLCGPKRKEKKRRNMCVCVCVCIGTLGTLCLVFP